MHWAKTTTRRDEKHFSFEIWCVLYQRFGGIWVSNQQCSTVLTWVQGQGDLAFIQIKVIQDKSKEKYIHIGYTLLAGHFGSCIQSEVRIRKRLLWGWDWKKHILLSLWWRHIMKWRLNSPKTKPFIQHLVRSDYKETPTPHSPHYFCLWGVSTSDRCRFPSQRASISIHDVII